MAAAASYLTCMNITNNIFQQNATSVLYKHDQCLHRVYEYFYQERSNIDI